MGNLKEEYILHRDMCLFLLMSDFFSSLSIYDIYPFLHYYMIM